MNSKLESTSNNDSNKEPERFNPLEHNVNINQEIWIQRQVRFKTQFN
jgi:hypothetical protein